MKTVLITGGTGSLGQQVIPHLLAQGAAVQAIARRPGLEAPRLTWIPGDLRDPSAVKRALSGAETLLHLATQPLHATADLDVAQGLLKAIRDSEIRHVVYMSITGLERMQGAAYYREKLEIERRIEDSGLPFTIQRSTQFHEFVAQLVQRMSFGRISLVPTGVTLQPVEANAVARQLTRLTLEQPARRVQDLTGPQPFTLDQLARFWQIHQGHRPTVLRLPLPVPLFQAWQHRAAVEDSALPVGLDWVSWLALQSARARAR
ncbi:SDR family oxidoreductase [Deinococcus humi]|uniref:Uncharacterized protein YbjT (DUF2867 family) n=1 Tax=Deinococcus humi TaxID=662880 RepID=A0A7W8JVE9_9DEIO|nr:uncharacterized protein YbjT (DUF2867 family) [Deinococcus humi]GGO32835.1 epimerase [Deinococcus humi]